MSLTSTWWKFLENYVYHQQQPPPSKRTKPLEVICVGPPRSATESLQAALLRLGYDYTYHGWDILFEQPNRMEGWTRLVRRKFFNEAPGLPITAADFDELMGTSVAVTDAAASIFAAEMIEAYPEAKVVLNIRQDLDAWMQSMESTILAAERSWIYYLLSWFDGKLFWAYNGYERLLWPSFFRCIDSREGFANAARARGASVYKEHCNMIRGMVPPDRLLEWTAQDGWEPLCRFLGKEVPDDPFPYTNSRSKGWKEKEDRIAKEMILPALQKVGMVLGLLVLVFAVGYMAF